MRQLDGSVALVTGGSAGIGLAVAREFADAGMDLVLAARTPSALEHARQELTNRGSRVLVVPTDVTDGQQRRRLLEATMEKFGRLDVLVNNAGIETFGMYHDVDEDAIQKTIEVNLLAALQMTRLAIPQMLAARRGHIVNMASIAGKTGPAYGAAYGASKAGLIAFTQSLRAEYHGTGVSASAICPGFTNGGGMYERFKQDTGGGVPWYLGTVSSKAVARASLQAVLRDRPETIVNLPPMRPVFVINQCWPRLGEWATRLASYKFFRGVAEARLKSAREFP